MRNRRILQAVFMTVLLAAAGAAAQPYPSRPIRLVVPFPPGTASDFLGRTIGAALGDLYKVQAVVDNRPGAGGMIGTTIVTTASPDGHTIGLFGSPYLTAPLLQAKPPYRPFEDGAPILQVADLNTILRDAQTKQRFSNQGAEPVENSSPEAFLALLRSENVRYQKLINDAGIQPQ